MYITTNYMPWTTSSRFDILVSSNSNTVYSTYTSNTSYFTSLTRTGGCSHIPINERFFSQTIFLGYIADNQNCIIHGASRRSSAITLP